MTRRPGKYGTCSQCYRLAVCARGYCSQHRPRACPACGTPWTGRRLTCDCGGDLWQSNDETKGHE